MLKPMLLISLLNHMSDATLLNLKLDAAARRRRGPRRKHELEPASPFGNMTLFVGPLVVAIDCVDKRSACKHGLLLKRDTACNLVCPDEAERRCLLHMQLLVGRVSPTSEPGLLVVEA